MCGEDARSSCPISQHQRQTRVTCPATTPPAHGLSHRCSTRGRASQPDVLACHWRSTLLCVIIDNGRAAPILRLITAAKAVGLSELVPRSRALVQSSGSQQQRLHGLWPASEGLQRPTAVGERGGDGVGRWPALLRAAALASIGLGRREIFGRLLESPSGMVRWLASSTSKGCRRRASPVRSTTLCSC